MGGSTIPPYHSFSHELQNRTEALPGGASGAVDQTHTNVRAGTLAVVIAHDELMHCGAMSGAEGDDDISGHLPDRSQVE